MRPLDRRDFLALTAGALGAGSFVAAQDGQPARYAGRYLSGEGDVEWLALLDTCARMLHPDPELQALTMLYSPAWNGFVEGPTWGAWWIQNSYGPSYCLMPYLAEPASTFLANAQELWFSQMGDGQREGAFGWVAPDGCLCDAASPGWIVYRQGDGRTDIHDWGVEFTAAGVLLEAERLLVLRDEAEIARRLPQLERCAAFLESRRDPANDLFLAGAAGNLLAPSYAGWAKPDGTYGMGYLTGLSVTWIAALDRLVEVERLAGRTAEAERLAELRERARAGLARLTTDEGYLIKSLDPDGTRHGVYGAEKYGYFEAVANHDAVAFGVTDEAQSRRIMDAMLAIPGLRPVDLIITNYPSLDDMYAAPEGLWAFGTWVNGGHWTTCEARMILAYFRLGHFDDARRAMERILAYARDFRLDNPLVQFGAAPYQPGLPINCVYDAWGAPLAMLRGLFEYRYAADALTLIPHIPPGITRLEQRLPVRFGSKQLLISTVGEGPITEVWLDDARWEGHDGASVRLPYERLAGNAEVLLCLGGAARPTGKLPIPATRMGPRPGGDFAGLLGPDEGNGRPVRIGADSNADHRFAGGRGATRLWSRALGAEEIAGLAAGRDAVPVDRTRLVAEYLPSALAEGVLPNSVSEALAASVVDAVRLEGDALACEGGYLEVASSPLLLLGESWSLETWIRPSAFPEGGMRIIDRVTAGIDDAYLLDTYPSDGLRLISERGVVAADARLALGEWVHIVGTLDSAGGALRLYRGGSLLAETPLEPAAPARRATDLARIERFGRALEAAGLGETYEAAHARLVLAWARAATERGRLKAEGKLRLLPERSQRAADRSYVEALDRLAEGLERTVESYAGSEDATKLRIWEAWEGM